MTPDPLNERRAPPGHFDILKRMCEKNLDIRMSLAENITNMKSAHKGRDTHITIGIQGNVISQILNATHNGGFLLWNQKQYYETKAEMEKEAAALSQDKPTRAGGAVLDSRTGGDAK